jgi:hypothetical protein
MSSPERTIYAREVAFPMVDAYAPAVQARIPIPGLTRWPGRELLGRHYYGLDQDETVENLTDASPGKVTAFNAEPVVVVNEGSEEVSGFAGFADVGGDILSNPNVVPGILASGGGPMVTLPPDTGNDSGGGIDWGAIIAGAIKATPAIIQASEGGGTPAGFYQQASIGGIQRQAPAGYVYNQQGQLVSLSSAYQVAGGVGAGVGQIANSLTNFVTQNPLLILGGAAMLFLLFMKPPGRR